MRRKELRERLTKKGFVLKAQFGHGAGHIHGRTLFVAFNSGSLRWLRENWNGRLAFAHNFIDYSRIGNLEFGFTQNANIVPYAT